ncbi:MAG: Na+/H+ antiporter NhaA [Firmicutes bacterium]|nr:Na+/H+ antiporter NhaA [Bacillota bacterium]
MLQATIQKLRDYSIPLIAGIVLALIWCNISPETYHHVIHYPLFDEKFNLHWLINDVFMCLFFGLAGIEIVHSLAKGGALNPINKAISPLMATAGGVLGPIAVFFILNGLIGSPDWANAWGMTTATDIAIAWLIADLVFGDKHPVINFLLLLAIVDDAIGLVIIAVFYPDPENPVQLQWLSLCLIAMVLAFLLGKVASKDNYLPFIMICGFISWMGMYKAHLHPALALVLIIPFIPRTGLIELHKSPHGLYQASGESALTWLEYDLEVMVDFGMFFFGFVGAGVAMESVSMLTVIVCVSLLAGKTFGITIMTWISTKIGCKLPDGVVMKDIVVAGIVAGAGLTVSLFVGESAFPAGPVQGAAKMGALCSVSAVVFAFAFRKLLSPSAKKITADDDEFTEYEIIENVPVSDDIVKVLKDNEVFDNLDDLIEGKVGHHGSLVRNDQRRDRATQAARAAAEIQAAEAAAEQLGEAVEAASRAAEVAAKAAKAAAEAAEAAKAAIAAAEDAGPTDADAQDDLK